MSVEPGNDDFRLPLSDPLTDEDVDYMATLAEFETEHRRILTMQALYYRRNKADGVA